MHGQHMHSGDTMAAATERVPVLMTGKEKAEIARKARQAGLSMGEYLRRAGKSYRPTEDDKALEGMIEQMILATDRADRAIDDALAFVEASNLRIAAMEAKRKAA